MQAVLLNSERTNLELPSTSIDENSWSKSIHDQQKANCTNTHTDDPTTNIGSDANSNSGYDVSHTSLLENTSFVDDHEIEKLDSTETKLFLNRNQCEPQRKSSRNPCGRLTGRASFIVESSLQKIADGERLDQNSDSQPERFCARKVFRRQSKFRSVGRTHNGGEYATPRMSTKDRKLLQMILVIFASFLVCYLPITITKLFQNTVDWQGLNIAGYILIYLTTCINPVIYVVMSSEYRSAYKYVLLCKRWTDDEQEGIPYSLCRVCWHLDLNINNYKDNNE